MRTMFRLAAVGLAVGVGLAAADPTPATTTPAGRAVAAVALDWTGPAAVRLGRPNPYTLTVTNTGRAAVQRVTVQVRPPDDATVTDTTPAARAADGVLVWEVGALEAGEAKPLTLTLTGGRRGDLVCPAWVTFTGAAGMAVQVQEPKLDIALKAPATVAVGDRFEVEAVVTNTGDSTLDGVEVRHTAPSPHPVDLGAAGIATAIDTMTETGGRMAPGQSVVRKFNMAPSTPGDLAYAVSARGRAEDGVSAETTARVRVIAPKLIAAITGPEKLLVGRPGGYTVTVKNVGELAVADTTVTVPLPAGLRAAGATDCKLSWSLGTLAPGDERTVRFTAVAASAGVQPVAANVTGSRGATATAACRTVVDGVPALRVELLDTADPVEVGHETVYEIRLTNTGTKADEAVTLACELPDGIAFVSATGPTGRVEPTEQGVGVNEPRVYRMAFEPVRELAPKTEAVFRVTVKAVAAGDVRFKAVVTSKHLATPVVKEESTRVYGD